MNLLLDTHAFIWLDLFPERLSNVAYEALIDEENKLYLSVASVWEMQIKMQLGKLSLSAGLESTVEKQQKINGIILLSMESAHVYELTSLANHHRDPFDRILMAQSIKENLTLVSADQHIQRYSDCVDILW
ncbi:MAG: type II toxin-antitoxin system VapC family toxin [Pseudomonadales bacterium]|nr:type II toxin-antitoxin system VapC family toxin [Pseudomonadales bacterium]